MEIREIVSAMTLEEKASICSGKDFWSLKGFERLGIPEITVTDGPHGLRKQEGKSDHLGLNASLKSTCFPSGATLANSWNPEILKQVGEALGEECRAQNVGVLLGPAMNIKRTPLCGRNFEYFSEDPYLSGRMATAHIQGVQSKGVGTCVKHYAVNNQEYRRFEVNALVDERTLQEIYLSGFESVVEKAEPWAVMCGFNSVNGTPCCENTYLLQEQLKKGWKYSGITMTDWAGIGDRVKALKAGLDLEMPGSGGVNDRKIVEAIKNGSLSEAVLDETVERILRLIFRIEKGKKENKINGFTIKGNHQIAYEAAADSIVLLKNEDRILPLDKQNSIAIIGEFACRTRFQGGGSSHINPTIVENAVDSFEKSAWKDFVYAQGYEAEKEIINSELEAEAVALASKKDVVLLYLGLPDSYESESFDRIHMRLPDNQINLLKEIRNVNKNLIVVLAAGSPIEMPWEKDVKAILNGYLFGQAGAAAMVDILIGKRNPCGKLAESFPKSLEDTPAYLNYPGEQDEVLYGERIFVGYRYYEKMNKDVLYPFGYGLSYTEFTYSDLEITMKPGNMVASVSMTVENSGMMEGGEIVQLYISAPGKKIVRPIKELKGFQKIYLKPKEKSRLTFEISKRDVAYYDVKLKQWIIETGKHQVLIGASLADIRLRGEIDLLSNKTRACELTMQSTIAELMEYEEGFDLGIKLSKVIIHDIKSPDEISAEERKSEGLGVDVVDMIGDLQIKMLVLFSNGRIKEEDVLEELNQINKRITSKN